MRTGLHSKPISKVSIVRGIVKSYAISIYQEFIYWGAKFAMRYSKEKPQYTFQAFPLLSAYGSGYGSSGLAHILARIILRQNAKKVPKTKGFRNFCGCGGRIRTNDLRVMSCARKVRPALSTPLGTVLPENDGVIGTYVLSNSLRSFLRMGHGMGQRVKVTRNICAAVFKEESLLSEGARSPVNYLRATAKP